MTDKVTMEQAIEQSTARFPFKKVKGKRGITFRQTHQREGSKAGLAVDIEHSGHDHLHLVFRALHETPSGRQGSRVILRHVMDAKATVQMASVLFLLAQHYMRDSSEEPYTMIVDKERAGFGPNWIDEDYATAIARTENRKARSHLYGLLTRCIETCTDAGFLQFLALNLGVWAEAAGDEFAQQQAEKALFQLGMVAKEDLDS